MQTLIEFGLRICDAPPEGYRGRDALKLARRGGVFYTSEMRYLG